MTDDHLSLDELAELDEGLLSADRISAIRAHLHGCEECRAKAEAITTTRSALSNLPPVTMPADVRTRIDNALADEARNAADPVLTPPLRAVELSATEDADPRVDDGPQLDSALIGTPTIDPSMRTPDVMPATGSVIRGRFGRPTMASSAAAAAVVLAVGAVIVAHFHHGSSTPPSSVASNLQAPSDQNPFLGTGPQPTSVVKSATGATYTVTNLSSSVKGVLARSPATGLIAPSPSASTTVGFGSAGGATAGKPERTTKQTQTSGSDASKAAVPKAESTLAQDSTRPIPKSLQPLFHSNAKILACAVTLTGQKNAVPEHVDFGRWTGGIYHDAPSAIFIFQGRTPSTVSVWVTNPTCSGNDIIRTVTQVSISS